MKQQVLKKITQIILPLIVLLMSTGVFAQNLNTDAKAIADQFYYNLNNSNGTVKNFYELSNNDTTSNYLFNYEDGGFVMVVDGEVSAFSEKGEQKIEGSPLEDVMGNYSKVTVQGGEPSRITSRTIPENREVTENVDPFLTDVWGGVNCFDNNGEAVYPGNYYTPSHCSAGCVAISMSQLLYYYKWPISGVGSNVFSDTYDGDLLRHSSFFDNITYDWDNMLDEYQGVASTDTERKAIGELYYSADCALEMNFEPTGSTSNINKTPFVYENFFRFSSHYEDVVWNSFWQRLYDNVQLNYPVPVAVDASATGDGHVFIADGYLVYGGNTYYHLNWGWYNDSEINGWYNIQSWDVNSPGYNTITGASFDVMPNPQIINFETTGNGDDFKVNWEVSERVNWTEFTLEQKVDQGNWEEVSTGITEKNYTITNPTGTVYQFRVKVEIDNVYYVNSWSEVMIHTVTGGFDGYGKFEGSQYAYAKQTPNNDLDFSGDYTFETWIRLKSNNSNGDVIMDQEDIFGFEITNVTSTDYSVKFISHSTNSNLNSDNSGAKIQLNEWTHIAVSHFGNTTILFVDGDIRHVNTGSNFNLPTNNNALNIAERYHGNYSGRIKADMDQIRISSIGQYTSSFTALKEQIYDVDDNTILYLPFQNVHKVRLKDQAHRLSVKVKNEEDYVEWDFEEVDEELLSIEEVEILKSTLSVYPNPVIDRNFQVSYSNELNLNNVQINLYDLNGRKINVNTSNTDINSWNITFNDINSGIYVLVIKGDSFTATRKLIIK